MSHECEGCNATIHPKRYALGYRTCLSCGDKAARSVKHCIAPLNKSNYVMITNKADLKGLNPKRVES